MTSPALSPEEMLRYSRHFTLPGVGVEGQRKLAASRVLIVGLGGLGSPVSLYLAAAGVGTLGLAEFDQVELHNLQRQVIHDTASVGTSKLQSAAGKLRALNPHVRLELHPEGVTAANILGLFAGYDVIVDGTDNFPVRYLNNDAAVLARKPLVYGSILQFEGQCSVFAPYLGGPCYRCLFPKMPGPGEVPNCAEAGVFGALCAMIGGMQVMETLKLLLGVGEPLLGRLLVCDTLGATFRTLRLKRDPDCPCCGGSPSLLSLDPARYVFSCAVSETPHPSPTNTSAMPSETPEEIDVHAAQTLLSSAHPPLLLDVRETWENQTASIAGSVLIPLGELAARMGELPKDRPILIHCHHGGRSMRATQFLRAKGFEHSTNLAGGIHQWSLAIDPSVPRY